MLLEHLEGLLDILQAVQVVQGQPILDFVGGTHHTLGQGRRLALANNHFRAYKISIDAINVTAATHATIVQGRDNIIIMKLISSTPTFFLADISLLGIDNGFGGKELLKVRLAIQYGLVTLVRVHGQWLVARGAPEAVLVPEAVLSLYGGGEIDRETRQTEISDFVSKLCDKAGRIFVSNYLHLLHLVDDFVAGCTLH